MNSILALVLAVSSWVQPQPTLSSGLIVVYGNQQLVQANATWHGYDLRPTHGCGLASISPAHLGQLAWVSVNGSFWVGPCLVVDVQGRDDAYDSIFRRHEITEVARTEAAQLGFTHGTQGFVYFGVCPPRSTLLALPYRPPRVFDVYGERTPSFYPYPKQQLPHSCKEQ